MTLDYRKPGDKGGEVQHTISIMRGETSNSPLSPTLPPEHETATQKHALARSKPNIDTHTSQGTSLICRYLSLHYADRTRFTYVQLSTRQRKIRGKAGLKGPQLG